jgi:hypothetical protein
VGPPRVAGARMHQVPPAGHGRAKLQGHAGAAAHGSASQEAALISGEPRAVGRPRARAHASAGHASANQARAARARAGAGVWFLARIRAAAARGRLLRVRLRALAFRAGRGDVLARAVLLDLFRVNGFVVGRGASQNAKVSLAAARATGFTKKKTTRESCPRVSSRLRRSLTSAIVTASTETGSSGSGSWGGVRTLRKYFWAWLRI